jgi:hypothetical protein
VGLKENVILGHLIPAGTGFRTFQDSEVRYRPEALQAMPTLNPPSTKHHARGKYVSFEDYFRSGDLQTRTGT